MQISSALNEYRLQGVIDFLALGSSPAVAMVYAGEQPDFGATATGSLLVSLPLAEPFGTLAAGMLVVAAGPETQVGLGGVAAWARVVNGAGAHAFDCPVSDLNGSAPIKLASTQLYAGGYTRVVSGLMV